VVRLFDLWLSRKFVEEMLLGDILDSDYVRDNLGGDDLYSSRAPIVTCGFTVV
jgi:hypothetical protein